MKAAVALIAVLAIAGAASLVSGVSCLDESGRSVDWFMGLKGPQIHASADPRIAAGLMYQYGDANSFKTKAQFAISPNKLDDPNSAFARTVQQTYAAAASAATAKTTGFVFYNDEVPNGKTCSSSFAHSKGVLAFDSASKTGYWLIHSMPNVALPPTASKPPTFDIPDSAVIYGQSFLCMSLDLAGVDAVLKQFTYHNPNIYGEAFPTGLNATMPNAAAFFAGTRVKTAGAPGLNIATIKTKGGQEFTHFGKSRQWGQDLYRDAISPHFSLPLAVETWMRPLEPSYVPPQSKLYVVNVQSTSMVQAGPTAVLTWTEEEDHSKWAISLDPAHPVVCIGDINKQQSQWGRGGGSACIQLANVHKAFVAAIGMVDAYKPAGVVPSGGPIPTPTASMHTGKATTAKTTPAAPKTAPAAKTKTGTKKSTAKVAPTPAAPKKRTLAKKTTKDATAAAPVKRKRTATKTKYGELSPA